MSGHHASRIRLHPKSLTDRNFRGLICHTAVALSEKGYARIAATPKIIDCALWMEIKDTPAPFRDLITPGIIKDMSDIRKILAGAFRLDDDDGEYSRGKMRPRRGLDDAT